MPPQVLPVPPNFLGHRLALPPEPPGWGGQSQSFPPGLGDKLAVKKLFVCDTEEEEEAARGSCTNWDNNKGPRLHSPCAALHSTLNSLLNLSPKKSKRGIRAVKTDS